MFYPINQNGVWVFSITTATSNGLAHITSMNLYYLCEEWWQKGGCLIKLHFSFNLLLWTCYFKKLPRTDIFYCIKFLTITHIFLCEGIKQFCVGGHPLSPHVSYRVGYMLLSTLFLLFLSFLKCVASLSFLNATNMPFNSPQDVSRCICFYHWWNSRTFLNTDYKWTLWCFSSLFHPGGISVVRHRRNGDLEL